MKKIRVENRALLFMIHHLTRGFFTTIYGGSRSGWLSPYRFPTRMDSVFLDTDFLKSLLTVPAEYLKEYGLYNELYRRHFPELLNVPTNSPLAHREDSCMRFMGEGTEPKETRKPRYSNALKRYIESDYTWEKQLYNPDFFKSRQGEGDSPAIRSFVDFEAWYRHFFPDYSSSCV